MEVVLVILFDLRVYLYGFMFYNYKIIYVFGDEFINSFECKCNYFEVDFEFDGKLVLVYISMGWYDRFWSVVYVF